MALGGWLGEELSLGASLVGLYMKSTTVVPSAVTNCDLKNKMHPSLLRAAQNCCAVFSSSTKSRPSTVNSPDGPELALGTILTDGCVDTVGAYAIINPNEDEEGEMN